jgi:antirestriction protein
MSKHDAWLHGETGDDGSHPGSPNYDDRRERAIEALLHDNAWVAAHTAEADEWNDGGFDGEHYSAIERALADLDGIPADKLLGSAALERVLRLAKVHGEARQAQLRMVAEREVDGRRAAA